MESSKDKNFVFITIPSFAPPFCALQNSTMCPGGSDIPTPRPIDFINSGYMQETEQDVIFQAIKFGSASLDKSSFTPPLMVTHSETKK